MDSRPRPQLLEMVRRASARERAQVRLVTVLLAISALALSSAGAAWILAGGRWISLPPLLPLLLVTGITALTVAAVALGWRHASRTRTAAELAGAVEAERALRRGSLAGLFEIEGAQSLRDRAAARLAASLPRQHLAPARERRGRHFLAAAVAVLIVATAGFTWSGARHRDAVDVLLHPLDAARGDLLPPLRLAPAALTVPRGSSLALEVAAPARRTIRIHTRIAGSPWRRTVHPVEDGIARIELESLSATTMIYASDARGSSDTVIVRTLERPFVRDLSLEAVYPRRAGRPPEPLPMSGQLVLPEGTTIRVRGRASIPLARAELIGPDGRRPLSTVGDSFAGVVLVRTGGALEWLITGRSGESVDAPPALQIALVSDLPPEIEIVTPGADTVVSGDRPLRVAIRATDDHELSSVVLRVRTGRSERTVALGIPPAGGFAALLLDVTALAPGAQAVLEATASESGGGGRRVASAPRTIRVMTAAEQRAAARRSADSAAGLAAGIASGQRQVERQTIETSLSRGGRRDGDATNAAAAGHALASRARALVDEQRSLATRADSLAAATRSLESRLARAGALDDGLAARLAEVRSLLERALTAELAARLREAEAAARANEDEPLRRALTDVAREQRRVREQLDRVVQMLRRAAIEGALETLRAEAAELALTPGSADATSRATRLETDIAAVVTRMTEENARAGVPPARQAKQRAGDGARELARGTAGRTPGAAALAHSAQALADARAAQIGEWKRELAAEIDAAVQELVQLSAAEESLAGRVGRPGVDWRAEHSALEESVSAAAARVARAARTSTLVSNRSDGLVRAAKEQVDRVSARTFPPRDATQTGAIMRQASSALSRAAASLVRDRDRTNTARSASGFVELLEELQRLARQQRALNAAAAGLPLNLLSGGAGARETARQLARQQRAIGRSLEELGEGDGGARAQPLAAEAYRIADALERATVDGSVIRRQERLYHRLLEGGRLLAGDSGEDDERRQAVAADNAELPVVNEAVTPGSARRHRVPGWNELRALTPAERQMIVEYFERLNDVR